MLVYGCEAVLPVEIKLTAAHLASAAYLDPFHKDYAIEQVAALERLDEYHNDVMAHYYKG